jgi:hypothetical protein
VAEDDGSPSSLMATLPRKKTAGSQLFNGAAEKALRVRVRALEIPPIKDGLLIGRDAAIGGDAMLRTLRLMTNEKFERLAVKDDIIQDFIVRTSILRKLGAEKLIEFARERIKPLMSETELLMLDIEVELVIEDNV